MKRTLALLLMFVLLSPPAFGSDGTVILPDDTSNTGKQVDHEVMPGGSYRQRVIIGDPDDRNITAHVTSSGQLEVNCTGCSAASVVNVAHVSAVTHVAAAGPVPVVQSSQGALWNVTAHQGGSWTVAATQSGAFSVGGSGVGNFVASQGTAGNAAWPVSAHQGGSWAVVASQGSPSAVWPVAAHQAGAWNTAANQSGSWTVQAAHQAGVWRTDHITSVTHVAGKIQANTGTGNLTCHSVAVFAGSASAIVVHAAGANRIFICGIVLSVAHATSVSVVEGTGAACGTGTAALLGSTDATNGLLLNQNQGFVTVTAFPWIATQTASNNLCVLTGATTRVNATITYSGIP